MVEFAIGLGAEQQAAVTSAIVGPRTEETVGCVIPRRRAVKITAEDEAFYRFPLVTPGACVDSGISTICEPFCVWPVNTSSGLESIAGKPAPTVFCVENTGLSFDT